jgi:nucleotide-binding universal stress UspA family protein
VEQARRSLVPLQQFVEGSGARAATLVVQTNDVSRTVANVATARDAELVVLQTRRTFSPGLVRSGTIGHVLDAVDADVLVLIDPSGAGTSPPPGGNVVVPFEESSNRSVRLAQRIARAHGSTVRLVASDREGQAATALAVAEASSNTIASTSIGSDDAVHSALNGGGADLVVLPLGGVAEDLVRRGDWWSTTPVLAVREKARAGHHSDESLLGAATSVADTPS